MAAAMRTASRCTLALPILNHGRYKRGLAAECHGQSERRAVEEPKHGY
jgi:hypothetical protein